MLVHFANNLAEHSAEGHFGAAFPGHGVQIRRRQGVQVGQGGGAHGGAVAEEFGQIQAGEAVDLGGGVSEAVVAGGQAELFVPALAFPQLGSEPGEKLDPHILDAGHMPEDPADGVGVRGRLPGQFVRGEAVQGALEELVLFGEGVGDEFVEGHSASAPSVVGAGYRRRGGVRVWGNARPVRVRRLRRRGCGNPFRGPEAAGRRCGRRLCPGRR